MVLSTTIFCSAHGGIVRNRNGKAVRYASVWNSRPVVVKRYQARPDEFRGVWVSVVQNLDFPRSGNIAQFKRTYCKIVDNIARSGCTAVIFQVRSNCDAFYYSQYAPWSRWLTGVEGRSLGANFDPVLFMIREAHRRKLEFHAWFNPYRVGVDPDRRKLFSTLHYKNFARRNPQLVLSAGSNHFLDPGSPEVRNHLCSVIKEFLLRYPVDAVCFDDYFYPYDGTGNADAVSFARNNPDRLRLADWRRANTEMMIKNIRYIVNFCNRYTGRKVRFGISPFGIWANRTRSNPFGSFSAGKECYHSIYADVRKWVKNNYVDFVTPQIYWHFDHDTAPYAALTDWWCRAVSGTNVKLYIGMAPYRMYTENPWEPEEIVHQLWFNRMRKNISGAAFFSYRHLFGAGAKKSRQLLKNF